MYGLFYDSISSSDCTVGLWRQMVGWLVNKEFERIWKEIIMA
jgi:hypothetical protein